MINRQNIYEKYNGHCWYCWIEIKFKEMEVDHIISKANFRSDVLNRHYVPYFLLGLWLDDVNSRDNLMPTCRTCNWYKSSMHLERFRKEIKMQVQRLERSINYKLAKRYGMVTDNNVGEIKFYFETIIDEEKI